MVGATVCVSMGPSVAGTLAELLTPVERVRLAAPQLPVPSPAMDIVGSSGLVVRVVHRGCCVAGDG